jgi:hypothetical protein
VARIIARRNAPGGSLNASLVAVSAVVMRLLAIQSPVGTDHRET